MLVLYRFPFLLVSFVRGSGTDATGQGVPDYNFLSQKDLGDYVFSPWKKKIYVNSESTKT